MKILKEPIATTKRWSRTYVNVQIPMEERNKCLLVALRVKCEHISPSHSLLHIILQSVTSAP